MSELGRLARSFLLLSIAIAAACGSSTPDLIGPQPVVQRFATPEYGVHTSFWWQPELAQRDVEQVRAMGFGWVKQSFAWRDIETLVKGRQDWYRPDLIVQAVEDAGLKLLVRLDRQPLWAQTQTDRLINNAPPAHLEDFGAFCGLLAQRYAGRIAAYQVWNEPNLSREWGEQSPDPVAYTALLKVCYQAIKSADPQAIVISAGLAPTGDQPPGAMPDTDFLRGMYAAGAADYFDVLGLNAPGFKAPPELAPAQVARTPELGGQSFFAFRHVEDMRQIMLEADDGPKQIAILEMGWTTDPVNPAYSWFAVDEQTQAEYLVRAYQYAAAHWRPWIGLMTTIFIADAGWTPADEQYWWSIVLPDGTPRPAYAALRDMPK